MNSNYKIVTTPYEAPSVACCAVFVEKGYSSTSKRGEIEDLGETNDEGYW